MSVPLFSVAQFFQTNPPPLYVNAGQYFETSYLKGMKSLLLYILLFCQPFLVFAQNTVEPDAVAFYNRSMPVIHSVYQNLVANTVRELKDRNINADSLRKALTTNAITKTLNPTDIDALIQWVLTESYLDTVKDLADMSRKVKYYNEVKKKLREQSKKDSLKKIETLTARIQKDIPAKQNRQNSLALQISKRMIKDRNIQNQVIQRLKTK